MVAFEVVAVAADPLGVLPCLDLVVEDLGAAGLVVALLGFGYGGFPGDLPGSGASLRFPLLMFGLGGPDRDLGEDLGELVFKGSVALTGVERARRPEGWLEDSDCSCELVECGRHP